MKFEFALSSALALASLEIIPTVRVIENTSYSLTVSTTILTLLKLFSVKIGISQIKRVFKMEFIRYRLLTFTLIYFTVL
jgi:hypothetical protein